MHHTSWLFFNSTRTASSIQHTTCMRNGTESRRESKQHQTLRLHQWKWGDVSSFLSLLHVYPECLFSKIIFRPENTFPQNNFCMSGVFSIRSLVWITTLAIISGYRSFHGCTSTPFLVLQKSWTKTYHSTSCFLESYAIMKELIVGATTTVRSTSLAGEPSFAHVRATALGVWHISEECETKGCI